MGKRGVIGQRAAIRLQTGSCKRIETARPQKKKQAFIEAGRVENISKHDLIRQSLWELRRDCPKVYYYHFPE